MASGMAKRFGSNKLLIDWQGKTLFENAIGISRFVTFGNTLVLTRHAEVETICLQENIDVIKHNMPLRNEMINLGVSHILKNSMPKGILFLPADQPLLSSKSMQLLCSTFLQNDSKISRLCYQDTCGSPVIFPMKYFEELLCLPSGKGGGFLVKKYPEQVIYVPVQDQYELYDIDTKDDLKYLNQIISHN